MAKVERLIEQASAFTPLPVCRLSDSLRHPVFPFLVFILTGFQRGNVACGSLPMERFLPFTRFFFIVVVSPPA